MPPSSLHRLHFGDASKVFADALICAFIALTEAISIGTTFATKNGYHINGNQEVSGCLLAQPPAWITVLNKGFASVSVP